MQYSTGNGGVTQTLTDVALYWWNRDLRPGVPNAVQKRTNRPDDSFWQNMTTFVVGYGLNASMDTPAVRGTELPQDRRSTGQWSTSRLR